MESSTTVSELIMFYNTENFFSPQKERHHRNYIPKSGLKNWNEERYLNKIFKFSRTFEYIREEIGQFPMLIGLAEVENDKVLQHITEQEIFEGNYDFVHYDSLDERGVDTALLYDKSKLVLLHSEVYSEIFDIEDGLPNTFDTTRDVLYCKFRYGVTELNVYVLHLPSKREKDVNAPKRKIILDKLKKRIQDKLSQNPQEKILVMGDFNENPDDANVQSFIHSGEGDEKILVNSFEELYNKKKYSTFHKSEGLLFDQIILSPSFFNLESDVKFINAQVFNSEHLKERSYRYRGRPFRTYVGTRYLGGYSDHFPVLIALKLTKQIGNI
ncbi:MULTISPECIES: endonuclease/exonuclease/phosphatase [Elizabethkingia]|uniref:Endonuclease n=1 Tax=Elizabethkingia anophelis R26 TaxID=1246994 RepID=A0ABN5BTL5_9FLAO|nr:MULTISPECIES: endonuclease/exonuclease/phosphatase [Elizabethkingia]ATC37322.1 endonuclease [Elizabethkingia anophelis R26]ATC41000.1 endonuclease [Elizabethkingia anophelis Ag1]ATC44679.1 endonuclease [Elizabethkingia anophelis]ATC48355.1 endonuclease [Elizabethkingia anophelis]ELR77886.1 non-specific nuclease [Elizabethkingia anophelis R26]